MLLNNVPYILPILGITTQKGKYLGQEQAVSMDQQFSLCASLVGSPGTALALSSFDFPASLEPPHEAKAQSPVSRTTAPDEHRSGEELITG